MTKSTETNRTIVVTFRLNAAEHAGFLEAAARADLVPSVYARHAVLHVPIKIKSYSSVAPEDIAQLKRVGNLLNQIARAMWRGRFLPATEEHLHVVLNELGAWLKAVLRPRAR